MKKDAERHPYIFAPRLRSGWLPIGEARGGGFALSEIPHPYCGLYLASKVVKEI